MFNSMYNVIKTKTHLLTYVYKWVCIVFMLTRVAQQNNLYLHLQYGTVCNYKIKKIVFILCIHDVKKAQQP
jgi:hypothetical protein